MSHNEFRNTAIGNLILVLTVWAVTTAAALVALMYDQPSWAKVALCWQIAAVPGLAIHKIIEMRQQWHGDDLHELASAYASMPMVGAMILGLAVFYLT